LILLSIIPNAPLAFKKSIMIHFLWTYWSDWIQPWKCRFRPWNATCCWDWAWNMTIDAVKRKIWNCRGRSNIWRNCWKDAQMREIENNNILFFERLTWIIANSGVKALWFFLYICRTFWTLTLEWSESSERSYRPLEKSQNNFVNILRGRRASRSCCKLASRSMKKSINSVDTDESDVKSRPLGSLRFRDFFSWWLHSYRFSSQCRESLNISL
jgi:hypothetical protein